MDRTVPILTSLTSAGIISLLASFSMHSGLTWIPPIRLFALTGIILFAILFLLQELLFRDYLIWWFAKFKEKSQNNDFPEELWEQMAIVIRL